MGISIIFPWIELFRAGGPALALLKARSFSRRARADPARRENVQGQGRADFLKLFFYIYCPNRAAIAVGNREAILVSNFDFPRTVGATFVPCCIMKFN